MTRIGISALLLAGFLPALAQASSVPVNLSTWTAESVGGANWTPAADQNSVVQSVNGAPTVFHNQTNSQGSVLSGTIEVQTTGDDDFIGFVLGYDSGDLSSDTSDFILIDWKQGTQTYHGGSAPAGLAISRVTGVLGDNSGAWWHDPLNNVEELARGTNFGSTGWSDRTLYNFDLSFTATNIRVSVNGVEEFNIFGSFEDGSFGFYNYSQPSVRYSGLTTAAIAPVPVPASLPLLLAGLGGLVALRRKRRT